MSHEDDYLAVRDVMGRLEISYQDFGYLLEVQINQICSELPLSKQATIRRLWYGHSARTLTGN
jgi:hypothetical protein